MRWLVILNIYTTVDLVARSLVRRRPFYIPALPSSPAPPSHCTQLTPASICCISKVEAGRGHNTGEVMVWIIVLMSRLRGQASSTPALHQRCVILSSPTLHCHTVMLSSRYITLQCTVILSSKYITLIIVRDLFASYKKYTIISCKLQ